MTPLDDRFEHADPARVYDLLDPAVRHAVADLAGNAMSVAPSRRGAPARRHRRRLVAVVALAIVLATASVAGAHWLSAHTGLFGDPGMTENDTSEWLRLGTSGVAEIARTYGRAYPLPPGGSFEPAIAQLTRGDGLIQATGVRALMATSSSCQWEREWLDARRRSDAERERQALAVLVRVPRWRVVRATDGGGTVAMHERVARAARRGDPDPVRLDLTRNCRALLP